MPIRNLFSALLLACAGLLTAPAASAGLLGKTLQVAYAGSSSIITVTAQTTLVTDGVEWTAWPTTLPSGFGGNGLFRVVIDITDTTIRISNIVEATNTWRSNTLYIKFTDINSSIDTFSPTLTSITQSITGLTSSRLNVSDDVISLNVTGLTLPEKRSGAIVLTVGFDSSTPTPVPTPAPILLIITGLLIRRGINCKHLTRNQN